MKTLLVTTALLLPLAAAAEAATVSKSCPAVSVADVESQFDRFNGAFQSGDPDKVTALFAPDATLLATVSNAERKTPELIRAYFVDFLKGKPVGKIETSTVILDCNTAKRSGNWTVTTTNAVGERVDIRARYSFVYRWDGKDWKIQHLHSSVRPAVSPAS